MYEDQNCNLTNFLFYFIQNINSTQTKFKYVYKASHLENLNLDLYPYLPTLHKIFVLGVVGLMATSHHARQGVRYYGRESP